MDEPSQPEEQPTAARRIAHKVLRMVAYMVSFVLLVWAVAVLRSPSQTRYEQDEMSRADARKNVQDRKQPRRVAIPAPISNNSTGISETIPRPLDANTTFEYQPIGFIAGERAEYYLRYLKVQVGSGVFEVAPRKKPGEAWHFKLHLSGMGDKFEYNATSEMDSGFSRSLSYEYTEQFPLSEPRTVRLDFNEANRTVLRHLNGSLQGSPIQLPNSYFDPLSMIYAFREIDFAAGQAVEWIVTDGKSKYEMSANVKGRQQIKIGTKEFRAILVEPNLGNFRGIFNKGKDSKMQIWFSDDANTLPLRLRFESPIGEITAELKDHNRPVSPRSH
jgi:hypothetical protein